MRTLICIAVLIVAGCGSGGGGGGGSKSPPPDLSRIVGSYVATVRESQGVLYDFYRVGDTAVFTVAANGDVYWNGNASPSARLRPWPADPTYSFEAQRAAGSHTEDWLFITSTIFAGDPWALEWNLLPGGTQHVHWSVTKVAANG